MSKAVTFIRASSTRRPHSGFRRPLPVRVDAAPARARKRRPSFRRREPAQVNFIGRDDFLRLLQGSPDAGMRAAEQLAKSYHAAQHDIRSLGLSQSTSEKLARLLLDWCEKGEE